MNDKHEHGIMEYYSDKVELQPLINLVTHNKGTDRWLIPHFK